ncbi:LuxR C-terminal-related transcriptional regulator [Nocardia albiluteola]|nr:LuxR C-terminal-related transcriptional regulator [Nocardia albiluteola]
MAGTFPVAVESLAGARDILRELESETTDPLVYLIRGRSGTGKSTLLGAIRHRLRGHGVTACDTLAEALAASDVDPADRRPGARPTLILDDAHTLSRIELERLCAAVGSARCTMVIAIRPGPHDPALRALADAVSRRGRVIDLRALGVADIAPFARELGMTVPRAVAQHVHRQTGGIHGGVVAALSAACATRLDAGVDAVDEAVAAWARSMLDNADPNLLEVFVVATTGAGLDPGEFTEVLGTSPSAARDLIDRARATALVTDADLLLESAEAPLRTLVGDRRYLAVLQRLLHARLAAGLLRNHTALLLAESGVRDPRLAEFLCVAAAADRAGEDAVRYYTAAVRSGADQRPIALRWAEAAARGGDGDTALRLAEPLLTDATPPAELAAAVRICAVVWTQRGLVDRAAQLYSWLGAERIGPDWAIGATVLYLAGRAREAQALSASAALWPPTEATTRVSLIAAALAQSLGAATPLPLDDRATGAHLATAGNTAPDDRHAPAPVATPDSGYAPAYRPAPARGAATADGLAPRPAGAATNGAAPAEESTAIRTAPIDGPAAPRTSRDAAVAAASTLIQAGRVGGVPVSDRLLPCAGTAIATLLCLSMGEPGRAADALRHAGASNGVASQHRPDTPRVNGGTSPAWSRTLPPAGLPDVTRASAPRTVLAAWTALYGGDEHSAATLLAPLDIDALAPRDRFLGHGLQVALARRGDDPAALAQAWRAACPMFDVVGADLLALLPIGELWLAGIRLRDEGRIAALVNAARDVLHRLGNPPAWANTFHWYAIQAAITRSRPAEVLLPARLLAASAATGDPHAAILAEAGHTWMLILRGQVARPRVEAAVRRLAEIGPSWDAARLAADAALATEDPAAAGALLTLARTVRSQSGPPQRPQAPSAAPAETAPAAPGPALSEREREVAELVLLGLTYREIGARLYISAKTVEHHVARIRRRIGAGSRSELLSMLRAMGHGSLLV